MNTNKRKDELLLCLRRKLVECGIEPDACDLRQLKTYGKIITACEERIAEIDAHKEALENLQPNKAEIAERAGLTRTSISASHNLNLLKIYDSYFPPVKNESAADARVEELERRNAELERKVTGNERTQADLIIARNDVKKLKAKMDLQAKAIQNLSMIIADLQRIHLEQTGEPLEIDIDRAINGDAPVEEENLTRKIMVPTTTKPGTRC